MDEATRTSSIIKIAAIPVILGIGALVWLFFFDGLHEIQRAFGQEERHNEEVGAKVLPKEKVHIVLRNKRSSCLPIDKAEVDGGDVWVYYHNACSSDQGSGVLSSSIELHWKGLSPDGTIITQDEHYTHQSLSPGQRAEWHNSTFQPFKDDPRISTVEFWMEP